MDNKYYTPEIEEFHIGFEYEYFYKNSSWVKHTLKTKADLTLCIEETEEDLIRVKYLDKEDIESLGFKEYVHSYGTDFRNQTHKIAWWWNNKGIEIRIITESGIGEKCVFSGVVKNKSELKRLLKQLNIL